VLLLVATWRNWKDTRFFIKVDAQNGGSPDLVMGYEEVAPGLVIPTHRHLMADEIVFVYRGSGVAKVGEREQAFTEGATIYIPRNVRVTIRSTGTVPLAIAFIFSKPGMEGFMRDNSVPVGKPAPDLSPQEFARIRDSHRWHVIYDEP
jgi:mannose-6-phosphate isomerase-like protein (cupin superfamily)